MVESVNACTYRTIKRVSVPEYCGSEWLNVESRPDCRQPSTGTRTLPRVQRKTGRGTVDQCNCPVQRKQREITYQGRDGKQYVVITATGGGFFNNAVTGDSVIAFALDGSGK